MTYYSKFIAAVVGLVVLVASRWGLDLEAAQELIVDALIAIVTAVSVYLAKNKPSTNVQVEEVREMATAAKKEIKEG